MHDFLYNFHFLRPYWLLSIFGVALLWWRLVKNHQRNSCWENICDKRLLPFLLTNQQRSHRWWPYYLILSAWIISILALAGPSWQRLPQAVYQNLSSTVIVLDMSNAMDVGDISPSRLERAKYKILDVLKSLRGSRIGMVVFTAEPFTVAPLTLDENTIRLLIPSLTTSIMPVAGCNIGAALQAAGSLLKQGNAQGGSILLITADPATANDVAIAKQLATQGIMINVLGLGTIQGAPLKQANGEFATDANGTVILSHFDKTNLETLANSGHGRYMDFTKTNNDITALIAATLSTSTKNAKLAAEKANIWYDEGKWLVAALLLIALIAFRRGYLHEVLAK